MRSSNKRAAVTTSNVVAAKRPKKAVVPDEVTALLKNVASSISTAAHGFMNLACEDTTARGRLVAILANAELLINRQLGVKRKASVLAVDDVVIDVLKFTSRKELDMMQLVNHRFNAIILNKLVLQCLRQLSRARLVRHSADKQFSLALDVVGAAKKHRFPTGVDDEAMATTALLNACRSSKLECLELYSVRDTAPMGAAFFVSLAQYAPAILLKRFSTGSRKLATSVPHDSVLRAFKAFAELGGVKIGTTQSNSDLVFCLVRICFKVGASIGTEYPGEISFGQADDGAVVKDALMEFCFGEGDDRFATRDRSLRAWATTIERGFLKEWIEHAETITCRHKLTLHVTCLVLQDLSGIDADNREGQGYAGNKAYFEGTRGRRRSASYNSTGPVYKTMKLAINH